MKASMRGALAAFAVLAAVITGVAPAVATHEDAKVHHLAIQIDSNDPALMNLVLNNAANATEYYSAKGEEVEIEIVAYGPGLHMLRNDTSPVKERVHSFGKSMPNVTFSACDNTIGAMRKKEGKDIPLLPEANVVPAGVVRLMELQEQGWTYVRP